MSIFGYPATITHNAAIKDNWNRVSGYSPTQKNAKVIEQQKLIKNEKGEEIQSIAEIHLEGAQSLSHQDYIEYANALGKTVRYNVKHIEIKKQLGTDEVKKVIIYA